MNHRKTAGKPKENDDLMANIAGLYNHLYNNNI
jgi:hypothetical protein